MINVSGWKAFPCRELFECKNTGNILARDVEDGSGNTPFVTASGYNNGVVGYIDASKYEIIKGHCILVGGKTFTITYQKDDFVSNDSHNFVIRVKDYDISDLAYLYLVSVIYSYFGQKYSWSDAVTKDKLLDENIPLPQTSTGEPDWAYMESYMKSIMEESEKNFENLKKADDTKHLIDTTDWGKFRVGNLFEVSRPSSRSSQKYEKGDMPFVASGNFNNGVTAYLQPKNDNDFDEGDCITVSAVDGYAFYQKDKFLGRGGAGSSIMMLRNDNLNEMNGKYICTLIRKACSDWEYSNMGNKDKLADTMIWLPITSSSEPDWQYMEDYMKQIMDKSEQVISKLQIGA